MITYDIIKTTWDNDWEEAVEKHGSASSVPFNETMAISERYRAMHCIMINPGTDPIQVMRNYNVQPAAIKFVAEEILDLKVDAEAPLEARQKIADKYKSLDQWAYDHPLEQVVPDVLVEMSGLSYASVMKYLKDTPRYKKVKNGLYEANEHQHRVI